MGEQAESIMPKNIKKMVLAIAALSLIVHFIVTLLFNNPCDFEYWLIIMQNVETGNGSYGLNGNFYTPVWGYYLSALDYVFKMTGWFPDLGQFFSVIYTTDVPGRMYVQPTPLVNFFVKLPLSICDTIVGYLLFKLIGNFTKDYKKGITAMCLWCFCPIVVYMSAIQGQFDTISTLFFLMCLILLLDDHDFLAGCMFTLAAMLKVFPSVCILVFICYVIVRHRNDGLALKKVLFAATGAAFILILLFTPLLMNNQIDYAFNFLSSRTSSTLADALKIYITAGLAVILMIYYAHKMMNSDSENMDRNLVLYASLMIVIANIIGAGYQYAPSVIVIIIIFWHMSNNTKGYKGLYVVLTAAALLEALCFLPMSPLMMNALYFGIGDPVILNSRLDILLFGEYPIADIFGIIRAITIILALIFMLLDTSDEKHLRISNLIEDIRNRGWSHE